MESLPVDLFIQQITYLPFEDVTNLCQVNTKFHEYCTNAKYANNWRLLIKNTFSQLDDYETNLEELLKKYGGYNYQVYTNFIKTLDPVTQAMIYYKQGDMKSFSKLTKTQKFLAMFLLGNKEDMIKYDIFPLPSRIFLKIINKNPVLPVRELYGAMSVMIREGSLAGVKYLVKEGALVDKNSMIQLANIYGKRNIVKYLESLP